MSRSVALAITAALVSSIGIACFSEHVAPRTSNVNARAICADPSSAANNVVITRDFLFEPATVTIAAGQTVLWVNCESTPGLAHTATADASDWDSGLVAPLESYERAFPAAGSFPYHCELHPGMEATVVVQ